MMTPPRPPAFMARAACLVPRATPRSMTCGGEGGARGGGGIASACTAEECIDSRAHEGALLGTEQTWIWESNSAASKFSISPAAASEGPRR